MEWPTEIEHVLAPDMSDHEKISLRNKIDKTIRSLINNSKNFPERLLPSLTISSLLIRIIHNNYPEKEELNKTLINKFNKIGKEKNDNSTNYIYITTNIIEQYLPFLSVYDAHNLLEHVIHVNNTIKIMQKQDSLLNESRFIKELLRNFG